MQAFGVVYEHKGAFVPGLAGGHVPGHRNTTTWLKTSNSWGGKQSRLKFDMQLLKKGMHADLKSFLNNPEQELKGKYMIHDEADSNAE